MAVVVTKPEINVRSELADLRKPSGIAGEAMLAADTIIQQAALLGVAPNNLVKNGAMAVYQRGAGTIVSDGSAVKEAFGPDRLKLYSTEAYTVLDATIRQTADGPEEFSTCSEVEIDTLEAVAAATDLIMLMYNFEGLDLQGLGWGTSAGKPLTLQFWVKSNTPGKYALSAYMPEGGGDIVTFAYTINQSAVWQKVVWVIPPNTAAVPANDNTASLVIRFVLAAGTTYKGGTPQPNWGANANNLHAAEQLVDLGAVDASYFRMTGVQATIGAFPEGVPFQHRSYGDELAACQRYYQKFGGGVSYGTLSNFGSAKNTTVVTATTSLFVPMRDVPALSTNDIQVSDGVNSAIDCTSTAVSTNNINNSLAHAEYTVSSGLTQYRPYYVRNSNNTSGYIAFDAEL
tara:strand:- start:269 stop:1471 length:1203 start_codon:yes stop_codon:yes gene_type:complete